MKIKLTASSIFAFLLLTIVMLELHELVHITVGRMICGCWGMRDFNAWHLCEGCGEIHSWAWLATLAGPLFSFALMWLGMWLLYAVDSCKKSVGFCLVFANIPFGRITQVMKGAGDEMVVSRQLLKHAFTNVQITWICSGIVALIVLPPVVKAFSVLINRRRWLYLVGFLCLPLLFILLYILIGMNSLLNYGFLSTPWIMGTPILISIHTGIAIVLLVIFRKNIYGLLNSSNTMVAES
ncbi:MAG: hypothetical protein ABI402_10585 [Ferruginibacter sp.]